MFIALVLLASACGGRETRSYPVTHHAKPFHELSEARGTAPGVVEGLTYERLRNARSEPHNWLTYYGSYDGQRYSQLDQINRDNIQELESAWTFQFGQIGLQAASATYAFEAAPIVVDGVMFVSGWDGYVWALDAKTGEEFWRYKHEIPLDTPLCCGNVNRGVAVGDGKVFLATLNGRLVALNARTGKAEWTSVFADPRAGESATLAPLVVKDKVYVGTSGAEYGIRGHIDAFDISTGERAWRRYTIPKPGEPGSETWPDDGEAWARGGGSTWITATYDPELDLMYWGTGNPSPDFDGDVREGDNLYTASVIAIDPDDGAMRWHYQWTPHDVWDYDGNNENILFELNGDKLLAHFDKNGHFFILDRANGELVRVATFTNATWGRIESDGEVKVFRKPTSGGTDICPGPAGGKEWNHAAYSPRSELLYVPVIEGCATFTKMRSEFRESLPYWGGTVDVAGHSQKGQVKAFDPATGEEVWSWENEHPMVSSILATAGDLIFAGEPDGDFNAYDAETGELLWQYNTGSGIHSNPVSYSVGGRQFIAVPSGWGGWIKGYSPEMLGSPRGNGLFVFSLPEE